MANNKTSFLSILLANSRYPCVKTKWQDVEPWLKYMVQSRTSGLVTSSKHRDSILMYCFVSKTSSTGWLTPQDKFKHFTKQTYKQYLPGQNKNKSIAGEICSCNK